ncbi:MAG: hypothetical protein O7A67_09605 [SAR324 cluster bacterium]|nr:hypothetical protein [SAR324 cluster bacterium]
MTERPMKRIGDSRMYLAEIVGQEGLHGQRMQAGAILDLMDVLAGRIAFSHSGSRVATLSFDRVDLIYPILHQDLIRLEGQLVRVGKSSMTIEVKGYRKDLAAREFMPVQRSFITMVAISEVGKSNPNIPGLLYETPEEERIREEVSRRQAIADRWRGMQEAVDASGPLRAADVVEELNRDKQEFLTPAETEIELRRQFLPRHLNALGTIFGGDLLLWMDQVATYTARHFTRNRNMVTLAMNRIFFKQPIFSRDLVNVKSRVVYVRRYTLEVEISVSLQRVDGEIVPSHSGYFTVLNYDEAGFKRPIVTGLRLEDQDQEGLKAYRKAKERHRFWREGQEASSAD